MTENLEVAICVLCWCMSLFAVVAGIALCRAVKD